MIAKEKGSAFSPMFVQTVRLPSSTSPAFIPVKSTSKDSFGSIPENSLGSHATRASEEYKNPRILFCSLFFIVKLPKNFSPGFTTARISSQEKRRSGVLYSYIPFISSSILRFMLSPFLCVNLTHDRLFLPNAIQIVSHSVLSGLTSVYSNIFFNSSIKVLTSLNSR